MRRNLSRDSATLERGLVYLDGFLELTAGAAVAAATRFVGGAWTKTNTGEYTLTLDTDTRCRGMTSFGLTQAWNGSTGNITNVVLKGLPSTYAPVTPATSQTQDLGAIVINTMSAVATVADTTSTMGIGVNLVLKNTDGF